MVVDNDDDDDNDDDELFLNYSREALSVKRTQIWHSQRVHDTVELVHQCFEPIQPQGIIPGLINQSKIS